MVDKNASFYLNQGNRFRKTAKIAKAIQFYIKAIQIDYSFEKPYKRLASIQKINSKQANDIVDCYKTVLASQAKLPKCALVQLGDLLTKSAEYAEAIHYYHKAAEVTVAESQPELIENDQNSEQGGNPDFMIIGAAKAGTTSLFHYIVQHPQVLPPIRKEVGFFHREDRLAAGIDWYSAHFPRIPEGTNFLTGEASPYYLVSDVHEKIFNSFPNVKLIVILRDPVERAISHYYHRFKHRWENRPFEEAINSELAMVKGIEEPLELIEVCRQNNSFYLLWGLYYYSLKKWFTVFPRQQFLILNNKQLLSEPDSVMNQMCEFLGLPQYQGFKYKKHNVGSYEHVNDYIKQSLAYFFQPHNDKLEEQLGIKLDSEPKNINNELNFV